MNWIAQVWQMSKREIRHLAPLLCVYVVLLAVSVARAVEWPALTAASTVPTAFAVSLCLALVGGISVQGDNPCRDDAFWATQPIWPTAVAAVKLLAVLIFVALCGAATFVSLRAWGYPLTSSGTATLFTMGQVATLVVGVSLVASVCSSLRMSALVTGALLMPLLVLSNRPWSSRVFDDAGWSVTMLVVLGLGVAVLMRTYRRRASDWWARGSTIVVAGVLLSVGVLASPSFSLATPPSSLATADVALHIPLSGPPACEDGMIIIPLEVVSPAWARVELTRPELSLVLASGDIVRLANSDWMQSAGQWGPLVPAALHAAVVDDEPTTGGLRRRRTDLAFRRPVKSGASVCGQVQRFDLRVQMRTAAGAELMRLPLLGDSITKVPGLRAHFTSLVVSDSSGALAARIGVLAGSAGTPPLGDPELEFALRRIASGEVVRLDNRAPEWMRTPVLPGLTRMWGTLRFELHRPELQRGAARDRWPEDVELIVIAPVWTARTPRSVSASVTVPPAAQRAFTPARNQK